MYLDPGADGAPILEKPPRAPHIDWCQYVRLVLDRGGKLTQEEEARFYEAAAYVQSDPCVAALVPRVQGVAYA